LVAKRFAPSGGKNRKDISPREYGMQNLPLPVSEGGKAKMLLEKLYVGHAGSIVVQSPLQNNISGPDVGD